MITPPNTPRKRWPRVPIVELFIILGVTAVLAMVLVPNFIKSRASRGPYCKSGLKNTAVALEMYSTDNGGAYPPSLAALTPNYLKVIPNCPRASSDTYSASYAFSVRPHAFTIYCLGHHHEVANYPQYSSSKGLIER